MSRLTAAVDRVNESAAGIHDTAVNLAKVTGAMADLTPEAKALVGTLVAQATALKGATAVVVDSVNDVHAIIEDLKGLPDKVMAVAGHFGDVGVKTSAILAGIRDGDEIVARNITWGPDGIGGSLRIVKGKP